MDRASIAKRRRLMRSSHSRSCLVNAMSGYTTGTSIDDLTNEVLIEIFLMLPAKTLHRFKTVSKRWLSLISSPCFARSYILTHVSDPSNYMILSKVEKVGVRTGQVYTLRFSSKDISNFHFIPSLVPPPGSNYLNYDDYVLDEIQADRSMRIGLSDKWLVDVFVKGTSGGLILLQGAFQNSIFDIYEREHDDYYYYYYVCNPVTKKWKELPLISTSDLVGFTCYHLQQRVGDGQEGECRIWLDGASYDNIIKRNTTFDPNKVEFTVVSIHVDEEDDVFMIKILSSTNEKAGWSTFCVPFPRGYERVYIARESEVLTFFNGKFHWRGRDCIVAYDPFNRPKECDIIPLPPIDRSCRYNNRLLGASEGCLRLVLVREDESFLVWELLDYATQVWVKKYEVNYIKNLIFISFVGGGGVDNDKVYMREVDTPSRIKILDLRNKSLQHIYTYPSSWENGYDVEFVETFLSSPWPTCVPLLRHK